MKKRICILSILLCAAIALSGCSLMTGLLRAQPQSRPGTQPQPAEHWVTRGIAGGIQRFSGDLELYLNGDGSAFVRFRDYNLTDYGDGPDEYEIDDYGEPYEEYGLYYTWRELGGVITFQQMDAEDYYVTDYGEVASRSVKSDSDRFVIGKGELGIDGADTMALSFSFAYLVEDGWTDPRAEFFVLEKSDDLSGQEFLTTRAEAEAEAAAVGSIADGAEEFGRQLTLECPQKVARVYSHMNYEAIDPLFFNLSNAAVLYSDGVTFAIVDTRLYPEYAQEGGAAIMTSEDEGDAVTVILSETSPTLALLCLPDELPGLEVLRAFCETVPQAVEQPEESGRLKDFYYSYGSGWEPGPIYELMALDLLEEDGEGVALLYISGGYSDAVEEGYPVEVPVSKLDELQALLEEHAVEGWAGTWEPDEMVTDGYGYYLAAEYEQGSLRSDGYMAYPPGYDSGHEAIARFFEELRAEVDGQRQEADRQAQLEDIAGVRSVNYTFGTRIGDVPDRTYQLSKADDGTLLLTVTENYEPIIENLALPVTAEAELLDIFDKHGVTGWDGFEAEDGAALEYMYIVCLLEDGQGNWVNMAASGFGAMPDGYGAFHMEFVAWLNGFLS